MLQKCAGTSLPGRNFGDDAAIIAGRAQFEQRPLPIDLVFAQISVKSLQLIDGSR
jgi:hypothetical protein